MDAETIKRLKAWFYLRLPPEHWTRFGENAEAVLRTFDDDPDQENALLEFAVCGNPVSEAHHRDYEKPLEVVWLCPEHHRIWHRLVKIAA